MWSSLKKGEMWTGEIRNRKKDGDLYWEYAKISAILDRAGEQRYYLKVAEDITEQKKLREDLILAKEQAEQSDRLKSAFLMNLSHEVRTPLNAVMGFTNLLKDVVPANDTTSKYIEHITKGGGQLLNIIENTIDMAKLENNQFPIAKMKKDLSDCLNEVYLEHCDTYSRENPGIEFVFEPDQEKVALDTDHKTLHKILGNLLDNAFKFTDSGRISIGSEVNGTEVQIFVKDTGIGIPEDMRSQIFDKFIKVETSERLFGGNGLGLSISQKLTQMLGGDISVESKEGVGSKFIIKLPKE